MLIKKLNNALAVQEPRNVFDRLGQPACRQAGEDELCTEVGFIKNKNKHNGCCYCRWIRFTDKLIKKI